MTAPLQTPQTGIALRYTLPLGQGIGCIGPHRPLMLAFDARSFAWMTSYDRWWRSPRTTNGATSQTG
ncbi:hypothetical protein ACQR50_07050 [Sphingomonas sp. Xoc002]|uniref:hypothetical protein n=1 Tax=Sphingomonas sp. Xoc002 TaxID=2837624 RepID=UPI003D17EA61